MDSKEIGHILLSRGLNFVGKPVDRRSYVGSSGGPKDGPPPREEWPILDPETRDEISFSNFRKKYTSRRGSNYSGNSSNSLPYLRDIQNRYNTASIRKTSQAEQTELGKLIQLNMISEDVAQLKDAIEDGSVRAIIGRYSHKPSHYAVKMRTLLNE